MKNFILYIVNKKGIYRHDIIGVFEDKQQAIESAKRAIATEPDDYHSMIILEVEANKENNSGREIIVAEVRRDEDKISVEEIREEDYLI